MNEWMNEWRSMQKKWAFKDWFVSRNRSYFDSFWWSGNIRRWMYHINPLQAKCCDQASLSTGSCLLVPFLGMLIICDMTVVGSGEDRHSHWFNREVPIKWLQPRPNKSRLVLCFIGHEEKYCSEHLFCNAPAGDYSRMTDVAHPVCLCFLVPPLSSCSSTRKL